MLEVHHRRFGRREMLRAMGGVAGGLILSSCEDGSPRTSSVASAPVVAASPTPTPTPTPSPVPTPTPTATPTGDAVDRIKAALAANPGNRMVMASDPLTISFQNNASSYDAPVRFSQTSANVRQFGGPIASVGLTGDAAQLYETRSVRYNDSVWSGQTAGFSFRPSSNEFEFVLLNYDAARFLIEIDGVSTNRDGYQANDQSFGALRYVRVQMPAGFAGKPVRITNRYNARGDILLPSGQTLLPVDRPRPADIVFIGDSITEAAQITYPWNAWPIQVAWRLGLDDPIQSGVSGSGFLAAANPGHDTMGADFTFRQRLADATQIIAGGAPDAVFVAGGINDIGRPVTDIAAEAKTYFEALRTAASVMPIFMLTPFTDYDDPGGSSAINALRDALLGVAGQVPGVYPIDVTGLVTLANRDQLFDLTVKGPHPTDAGHLVYGEFIADAAARIIRTL